MHAAIKRFTQESTDFHLIMVSLVAAVISLRTSSLAPALQFASAAFIVAADVLLFSYFQGKSPYKPVFSSIQILSIYLISSSHLELIVSFAIISIFLVPLKTFQSSLYPKAFLFHITDAISTYISLFESGEEANILLAYLIQEIGALPALISSKIFLVGLPLYFAQRNFGEDGRKVFGIAVLILGASLTIRNLILFISQL
jgi:hypothetical protein